MNDYMVEETSGGATVRYDTTAAVFHWLTAALVLVQFYLGFTFHDYPRGSPERTLLFGWHKTLGVAILVVALLRLGHRLISPPPPYPSEAPRWDRATAVWTHRLFYLLLIVLPVTGLAAASRPGKGSIDLVGGLQVPAVPLGKGVGETHQLIVWVLIALLVLHVSAAIWHQFIRKDRDAGRMPPFPVIRAPE